MFSGIGRMVVGVADLERALGFYRDVLGFEVVHDEDAGGFRYLHVGLPGQEGTGIWLMQVSEQPPERPLLVLYTGDLGAVEQKLAEHGTEIWARGEDASSRSLHFSDVDGNVVIAAQLRG